MPNRKHLLQISGQRLLLPLLALGIVAALVAPATAAAAAPVTEASSCSDHRKTQRALDELTGVHDLPGATVEVTGPVCGRWIGTNGVANIHTQRPMLRDPRYRIASVTKTFTATVVLQLVAEDKVALDAPIERYLPGLIQQNGYDGRDITVRELLQHTSGLPDHLESLDPNPEVWRYQHVEPAEAIEWALAMPPPDTRWYYSTTNYVVAGLLVERVTGHRLETEVERRIIHPLGLRDTYWPGDEVTIRGPHPRGYHPIEKDGTLELVDFTKFNVSVAGAGGALISSNNDLNTFYEALLSGRLLPRKELAEMRHTVKADPERIWPGARYGLGLISTPLKCGGLWWGHGGSVPGFRSVQATTPDGRQVAMVINEIPPTDEAEVAFHRVIQTALCETTDKKGQGEK